MKRFLAVFVLGATLVAAAGIASIGLRAASALSDSQASAKNTAAHR